VVALGCVAQVVLRIPVENSCRNIQPDIVRGADWAFCPWGCGFEQGEVLDCVFMCAHSRLAVYAVLEVSLGVLQVIAIADLAWRAIRSRLEKLIDLVAIEMFVQLLLLSKTITPEQTLRVLAEFDRVLPPRAPPFVRATL
jgi:hypothetical protein